MREMKWVVAAFLIAGLSLVGLAQQKSGDDPLGDEELDMLKRAFREHKEESEEEFGFGSESEGKNPLEQVVGQMKVVERRLSKRDVGKHTQQKELDIVRLLNELIRKIEENAQQSSSSSQQKKGQKQGQKQGQKKGQKQGQKKMSDPNRSSNAQPGSQRAKAYLQKVQMPDEPGRQMDPKTAKGGWFPTLPGERREEAAGGASEKFHPKWGPALEEYFKELMKGGRRR